MHARLIRKWSGIAVVLLLTFGLSGPGAFAASGNGSNSGSTGDASVAYASAGTASTPESPAVNPSSAVVTEVKELEQTVAAHSKQFDEHSQELDAERAELHDELARLASLEAKLGVTPDAAVAERADPAAAIGPSGQQLQGTPQINITQPTNPLSFKIGGAEFTPGGFIDLTGIFRSADVGSGLGTNFTNIPYNTQLPLAGLSESRFTAQGTRLSLKVETNINQSTAVTGYVESDFNGFEPANSNISTKSDSFRLRIGWVQIRHSNWELGTGQMWTLLTPTRVGLSPLPENIFTALRLDTSYLAGLVYDRQPGVRLTYHATKWWTTAIALENPQQFVPSSVVLPTDGSSNYFTGQFDNGSSSTSAASSAINPTVPNLRPDLIVKTAFDFHVANHLFHIDADLISRSFRIYNNLSAPAGRNTIEGGGGGLNANLELFKNFHLIENAFWGDGVGRYIGGLGPDVVITPQGNLSAVHAGGGVGGFEWQTTPRFLVDGYYSAAYFARDYQKTTSALGSACGGTSFCVGYGFPGSPNTDNRDFQEATVGFIPTIWSSPNFGRLQFISQFSYVVRTPWYVATNSPKNAHIFIAYVNLRYIIP